MKFQIEWQSYVKSEPAVNWIYCFNKETALATAQRLCKYPDIILVEVIDVSINTDPVRIFQSA